MRRPLVPFTLALLLACNGDDKGGPDDSAPPVDDTGEPDDTDSPDDTDDSGETDEPEEVWLDDDFDAMLIGEVQQDAAGCSVIAPGDVDGDGLPDLAIGAEFHDGDATWNGAVYVVTSTPDGSEDLGVAEHKIYGAEGNDRVGGAVDAAGDVDGDGRGDLIMGAALATTTVAAGGKAYLALADFITSDAEISLSEADAVVGGSVVLDRAGSGVAGIGDIDGDDGSDLAVGVIGSDVGYDEGGAVYVINGVELLEWGEVATEDLAIVFTGTAEDQALGDVIAGLGDVDGDGLADLGVGYPSTEDADDSEGTAYIMLSSSALAEADGVESAADANWIWGGASGGDMAGTAMIGPGDIDGDGYDDVFVGAPRVDGMDGSETLLDSGAVYLLLGGGVLAGTGGRDNLAYADARFDGTERLLDAASYLSSAGDVDGDGRPDVLVGTASVDFAVSYSAPSFLMMSSGILDGASGVKSLSRAEREYRSSLRDNYPNTAQAGIGDRDGNGKSELAFGAFGYDYLGDENQRVDTGAVFLFYEP